MQEVVLGIDLGRTNKGVCAVRGMGRRCTFEGMNKGDDPAYAADCTTIISKNTGLVFL